MLLHPTASQWHHVVQQSGISPWPWSSSSWHVYHWFSNDGMVDSRLWHWVSQPFWDPHDFIFFSFQKTDLRFCCSCRGNLPSHRQLHGFFESKATYGSGANFATIALFDTWKFIIFNSKNDGGRFFLGYRENKGSPCHLRHGVNWTTLRFETLESQPPRGWPLLVRCGHRGTSHGFRLAKGDCDAAGGEGGVTCRTGAPLAWFPKATCPKSPFVSLPILLGIST